MVKDLITPYKKNFVCKWCQKSFVHEDRYIRHKCDQMKKFEELQSPTGQAAYQYYQQWMRSNNRMPPPAQTFLTSKFFRTFVNFATFVKKVHLPYTDKFIWLMKEKDIPPTIWTNDQVYTMFLEFIDHKTTPLEQLKTTVNTLFRYSEKHEIDVSECFKHMSANDVIIMLRTRQLSPWFLLFSKEFKDLLLQRTSPEQKVIIETLIRPDFWADRIAENQQYVEQIKKCVRQMDL